MKTCISALLVLIFSFAAQAQSPDPYLSIPAKPVYRDDLRNLNQILVDYVRENTIKLERIGAGQMGLERMTIDTGSYECLGARSSSGVIVGVCKATGDLDYPNSSSTLSIVIKDQIPSSGDQAVEAVVSILTAEI